MRKINSIALCLICVLTLSGCASGSLAQPPACKQLPPAPPSVMTPRPADFSEKMRNFLFDSPVTPTP